MAQHYHFIGIGGIGMSGLARILLAQNKTVSGSDIASNAVIDELIKQGAKIHKGHAAHHIPPQATVVFTSDVKPDNPEYDAALKNGSPLLHRADLLAKLVEGVKLLAVTGTHGKTTTSSLLATVLIEGGLAPSFAIGGVLPAFQTNAQSGSGEYFVIEADESDRSFLKFHPFGAIITNIDNDHLVNYDGSMKVLIESFTRFTTQVQSPEHLIWCKDDPYLPGMNIPGQSYGFHPDSDWKITAMRQEGFVVYFDLQHNADHYKDIALPLAGKHNVSNAAAVFALAHTLGISEENIRKAFQSFQGVLRRCEYKGSHSDIDFFDDYAHHPTEIQTTLQGIRQAIGTRRLIAVFQPHRYTRVKDCLGSYGNIFDAADLLLITDIYGAGEKAIEGLSHSCIHDEIKENSKVANDYVARTSLSNYLKQCIRPTDIVVTLGAGDITKLSQETLDLLKKQRI